MCRKKDHKVKLVTGISFMAKEASQNPKNERLSRWVLESGSTDHICNDISKFTSLQENSRGHIKQADGSTIACKGIGKVSLYVNELNTNITLEKVL